MTTNFETGHGKNVTRFNDFISKITLLGEVYNPSNPLIKLDALNQLHQKAKTDFRNIDKQSEAYNRDTNDRQAIFKATIPYVNRVVSSLLGSQVADETINDAKRIKRKFNGQRAKAIADAPPLQPGQPAPEDKTISASQRSYDSQANHFSKLVELVSLEPLYKPNEEELRKESVINHLNTLDGANEKVILTTNLLAKARADRNTSLYMKETGVIDIVQAAKEYVKSLKDIDPELKKEILGVKLIRIVKKAK